MEPRKFTTREEIAHIFTHALGALASIYGLVILHMNSKNLVQIVSTTIFGASLLFMFLASVCYHAVRNKTIKIDFEKIDHTAIYILIAGTYTPTLMLVVNFPLNIILVAVIWCLAIIGIVFTCITLKSPSVSTALYLLMGWISVFLINYLWTASHLSFWLMLSGGIFYSIGCIFYLMKIRYMHTIWHLLVIAGAAMQYFSIIELLKAVN